uniref:Uncharacterized protein n=1 Tax=Anopheles coluzzii TaxID=1518534 RepID=A0A8W7PW09_ANOCL
MLGRCVIPGHTIVTATRQTATPSLPFPPALNRPPKNWPKTTGMCQPGGTSFSRVGERRWLTVGLAKDRVSIARPTAKNLPLLLLLLLLAIRPGRLEMHERSPKQNVQFAHL